MQVLRVGHSVARISFAVHALWTGITKSEHESHILKPKYTRKTDWSKRLEKSEKRICINPQLEVDRNFF